MLANQLEDVEAALDIEVEVEQDEARPRDLRIRTATQQVLDRLLARRDDVEAECAARRVSV